MLLSCCFRNPKGKKCKARKDGVAPSSSQKQAAAKTGDSQCLLLSPRDPPPHIQASIHAQVYSSSPGHVATVYSSSIGHVATVCSSSPRHVSTIYTSTPNPCHQQAWTGMHRQGTEAPLELKLAQKERYPPTKEAKRLHKQRSQDSVSRILAEGAANHRVSIPYIDQSPIDPALPRPPSLPKETPPLLPPSHIHETLSPPPPHRVETISPSPPLETHLSSPPLDRDGLLAIQHGRRDPKITACSVPNLSQQQLKRSSLINQQVEKSVSVGQVEKLTTSGLQTDQNKLYSPSRSEVSSQSHSDTLGSISNCQDDPNIEKEVFVSKMQRSTASYGIKDLLQEQIKKEEVENTQRKQEDLEENLKKKLKIEYEDLLEKKDIEHKMMLEKVKSHYETQLFEKTESHQNELDNVVMKSKNELNAVIIQHENELEIARQQIERVKSESDSQRDWEIFEKEAEWTSVKQELEQRDRLWQEEKHEVLAEVQRLKAEAGRMVAILAMEVEEEEELLSEESKRTLQQEVESLKMVVEMKTAEVKRLKARHNDIEKQLEELDITKNELTKMRAKVEDLQSQLDQKNEKEKELSMEKSKLEAWMEAESRTSARKSLEVEQLQWRIRHNMDLPPVILHQSISCPPQDLSPKGVAQRNSITKERPQSAPTSIRIEEYCDTSVNGLDDVKEVTECQNGSALIDEDSCHSCSTEPQTSEDTCQSCLNQMELANSQDKRCEIIYDNMSTVRESVSHFEKMISSESHKSSSIDVEVKADMMPIKYDDTFKKNQEKRYIDEIMVNRVQREADATDNVTSYDRFNGAVDDASDEGLGDISSENESGSPQPGEDNKVGKNFSVEKNIEIVKCAQNINKNQPFLDLSDDNENINVEQIERNMSNPADDRMPSRMPFETPL